MPEDDEDEVPFRYRLKNTFRPSHTHSIASTQDCASINHSIFPGWNYAPFRPNAYFPSGFLLLFFIPEIRHEFQSNQYEYVIKDNYLQKSTWL